jgi:hypothetical protein
MGNSEMMLCDRAAFSATPQCLAFHDDARCHATLLLQEEGVISNYDLA